MSPPLPVNDQDGGKFVAIPDNDPSLAAEASRAPTIPVPEAMTLGPRRPHVASMAEYQALWRESVEDPAAFFGREARDLLTWFHPFAQVQHGGLLDGDSAWFVDGTLNVAYNCVDRHARATPDKVAIIYEPDDPAQPHQTLTYRELLGEVCRVSNALLSLGLRKGDRVGIYMPMIPAAAIAMLACARLGLVHSVVFAGFSAEALCDRLVDGGCRVLLTADEGVRAGKMIPIKNIADAALRDAPQVQTVVVYKRTGNKVHWHAGRDVWWDDLVRAQRPYCPAVHLSAEDPLFTLYTSGSTGRPKGLLHTCAGYLLGAAMTTKYVFDVKPEDIYGCMADVGWITGHTYIVYGPLCLGATTVLFESIPTYPAPNRYWELVEKHKITQFYTAPTAIRALRRHGDEPVLKHDLSSLRVIGSVGEPINPDAWQWYNEKVGKGKAAVVDTYWQTETGSHVVTPLPGAIPTKPGAATLPFFGIDPVILDSKTGKELDGPDVTGVLCFRKPWPSMARTVFGDHERYMETYLRPYKGYYFTGDGATRDKDGYIWIRGRVDDVINVSGHRLSTAEVESALVAHETCAEAAVIGAPDELTGQKIVAFVTLKLTNTPEHEVPTLLTYQVRKVIGPIAAPKKIVVVPELPKTRSGKIMRRILRKICSGEADQLGDISTLADPNIIKVLVDKFNAA